MKKIKFFFTIVMVVLSLSANAQKLKEVDTFDLATSFKEVKKLYKANFMVKKNLILKDGSIITIGDTIKLGQSSSKVSNTYETIFIGKLTVGGALMGKVPVPASTTFEQNTYVLEKVKVSRSMGKTGVRFELRDVNFKSGLLGSAYLTASDYSVTRGRVN